MRNDIAKRPSRMVENKLFQNTNPDSLLRSPPTSFLSTWQSLSDTSAAYVIRVLEFALPIRNQISGGLPRDERSCKRHILVCLLNHKGCFRNVCSVSYSSLTF